MAQIAEDAGVSPSLVNRRYRAGYRSIEDLTSKSLVANTVTRRADGKSLAQIADEAGVSVNTVRERWKRGDRSYERLSRRVKENLAEDYGL